MIFKSFALPSNSVSTHFPALSRISATEEFISPSAFFCRTSFSQSSMARETIKVSLVIKRHAESSDRSFSFDEINLVRQTVKTFSNLSLTELSKTLCELLEWIGSNGKLKRKECRALLEQLQSAGAISLHKLRAIAGSGR
jgi:hypothetical protein